jgi:hypothetical protein
MSTQFNALEHFERLYKDFHRDRTAALKLESANAEDSLEVRTAVIGFSYNSSIQEWRRTHFEFLRDRLKDAQFEKNELLFVSLCLGFLLGLFQADKITEIEFDLAEAQLPGFVLLKGGKFD